LQWPRWLLSSYSILRMSISTTLVTLELQQPCFPTSPGHSARPPQLAASFTILSSIFLFRYVLKRELSRLQTLGTPAVRSRRFGPGSPSSQRNGPSAGVHAEAVISSDVWSSDVWGRVTSGSPSLSTPRRHWFQAKKPISRERPISVRSVRAGDAAGKSKPVFKSEQY
jgi:hypothetical protein